MSFFLLFSYLSRQMSQIPLYFRFEFYVLFYDEFALMLVWNMMLTLRDFIIFAMT